MTNDEKPNFTRRQFLTASAAGAVGLGMASLGNSAFATESLTDTSRQAKAPSGGPYNILFILTDQERYFDPTEYPSGYVLPGREGLDTDRRSLKAKRRIDHLVSHQVVSGQFPKNSLL